MKIDEIKIGGKYRVMVRYGEEPIVEVLGVHGDIVEFKYVPGNNPKYYQLPGVDTCHGAWLRELD